ncbi:MAG TPA: hypothetical protein VJW94_19175 [Candidatus Acidoferrum sp.]|nr:hypothetical protein [Candidatus Acidoferrum sp.]
MSPSTAPGLSTDRAIRTLAAGRREAALEVFGRLQVYAHPDDHGKPKQTAQTSPTNTAKSAENV